MGWPSIIISCKNREKVTRKMKIFLDCFWTGLVFNWMEMAFLYRLRSLARDNALYGADTSVRARQEKVASDTIEADNLGPLVYLTPQRMETLTYKIISNAESECAFDDNNEMSNRLLREIDSLMHL